MCTMKYMNILALNNRSFIEVDHVPTSRLRILFQMYVSKFNQVNEICEDILSEIYLFIITWYARPR